MECKNPAGDSTPKLPIISHPAVITASCCYRQLKRVRLVGGNKQSTRLSPVTIASEFRAASLVNALKFMSTTLAYISYCKSARQLSMLCSSSLFPAAFWKDHQDGSLLQW